ncbi:type II toxin-antitoxin system prevent-host-death family antitoxin [Pseudoxanthobacter sp. M-2]|uniref:type II toxin-antitoxin system Phd/YefM family antitoxin n=1 Tax=Pseudoxanthobacter sp. M-2 TaxID=3078754 RepID=UPI0038FCA46A
MAPRPVRTTTVGSFEAKTHLAALIDRAAAGEEVIITRRGKPVARLVAMEEDAVESDAAARDRAAKIVAEMRASSKGIRLDGLTVRELRDEGRE